MNILTLLAISAIEEGSTCPSCEKGALLHKKISFTCPSSLVVVPQVAVLECSGCGEHLYDIRADRYINAFVDAATLS